MTSPERPLVGLMQDALQAGPLCPRVPVLSILELASRDARRRPLCLPADASGDSHELSEHLDSVRRHVYEDACPTCRRWYRNATVAYFEELSRKLQPFTRQPHRVGVGPDYYDFAVAGRSRSGGLGALEGRLVWRRETNEAGWRLLAQFRGVAGGKVVDLSEFAGLTLEIYFDEPGRDAPSRVTTHLTLGGDGVLTTPEEFVELEHPDRVRRVRFQPRAPWGMLE